VFEPDFSPITARRRAGEGARLLHPRGQHEAERGDWGGQEGAGGHYPDLVGGYRHIAANRGAPITRR